MITQNLSNLKIHKLTQEQYDRELAAGNIDPTALYLTPQETIDLEPYALKTDVKNYKLIFNGSSVLLSSEDISTAASSPTDSLIINTIQDSEGNLGYFGVDWENIVNIPTASTTEEGVVQLLTSIDSDYETYAATPKSVKNALDESKSYTDTSINNLPRYSKISLENYTSTLAGAPEFNGVIQLPIETGQNELRFQSGNNLIEFSGEDQNNLDIITITVYADPEGSAEEALNNAKSYTDSKIVEAIADLVDTAPETLDTLGELATALKENEDVVNTLNSAVGDKVNKTELEENYYTKTEIENYINETILGGSW